MARQPSSEATYDAFATHLGTCTGVIHTLYGDQGKPNPVDGIFAAVLRSNAPCHLL
jgi:hypothetical protein